MSVVGEFTIAAEAFALAHALSTVSDVTVEADRLASHSPREVFPFLWVSGEDREEFTRALEEDAAVESASIADEMGEEILSRLTWNDEFLSVVHDMIDHQAAILEARVVDGQWILTLRFADEKMVSRFQTHFQDTGRDFDVNRLYHPTEPREREFGLTAGQREALVTAAETGYFSIPRTASTEHVAASLGISANAASERIRRGCDRLVHAALMIDDGS